ncbi:MAG: NAD(+)/NADH kinase [Candidatus Omnitrophica bacterium]|nr:NAD(+)/NADH kinase [Candidatus Omnitrophota bacterium]
MARKPRVLLVYKKDAYQQYIQEQQDPHLIRLLRRRHRDVLEIERAHRVHEEALESIIHILRQLPVELELAYRADLKVSRSYDLVVSVGGDGTFLHAARSVGHTPILGVNSDPARSEAVFCAATAQNFPRLIRRALRYQLPQLRLCRLELAVNGTAWPQRALNDILLAHEDPSIMTRYRLRVGSREETQRSSGLWVATAAGSSSAVLAAGGVRLPWSSRRFQYRPRELYQGRLSRSRLLGGVLSPRTPLRVTWLMRRGCAFLDGPHVKIPLQFADRLDIRLLLSRPLRVLGFRPNDR